MGTEYWILKCPQFISYIEKQRLKSRVEVRLLKIQYLKQKPKHKKILEIYMKFSLKIRLLSLFFLQCYSEMKMKIKE